MTISSESLRLPRSAQQLIARRIWLALATVIAVSLAITLIAPGSEAADAANSVLWWMSFPTSWVFFVPWYVGSAMIAPFAELVGGARLAEGAEVALLGVLLMINVWLVYGLVYGVRVVLIRSRQARTPTEVNRH